MKGFIEVIDKNGRKHLINVRYIEEVYSDDKDDCYIYLAFNCPGAVEQDYIFVYKPYDEIKRLIEEASK